MKKTPGKTRGQCPIRTTKKEQRLRAAFARQPRRRRPSRPVYQRRHTRKPLIPSSITVRIKTFICSLFVVRSISGFAFFGSKHGIKNEVPLLNLRQSILYATFSTTIGCHQSIHIDEVTIRAVKNQRVDAGRHHFHTLG